MTESTETTLPEIESAVAAPKERIDWWAEAKGIFWLILAVLGFHSFIAKPFYIPSESMVPGLLVGDRLVVSKYPYGWSHASVTIPNPVALFRRLVLRDASVESLTVKLPEWKGRLLGRLPERGDVVIALPPGRSEDYIKRLVGLPGDRIEVRSGTLIINNVPVKRAAPKPRLVPIDANTLCEDIEYPGLFRKGPGGKDYCELPFVRETLPNGVSYDTIDLGYKFDADDYAAITIPADHVFLMGDNRDRSADSRFSLDQKGLGGPVPIENIGGRAEFITFSLDGTSSWWNPISWFTALRSGRAGTSLRPDKEE